MLDAHASLLEIVDNLMLVRKIANNFRKACALDIFCRLEMIRHERDLLWIEDRPTDFLEFRNRRRRRDIIRQHHIEMARNQLPWMDLRQSCMLCENLLAHIHAHTFSYLSLGDHMRCHFA